MDWLQSYRGITAKTWSHDVAAKNLAIHILAPAAASLHTRSRGAGRARSRRAWGSELVQAIAVEVVGAVVVIVVVVVVVVAAAASADYAVGGGEVPSTRNPGQHMNRVKGLGQAMLLLC